MAKHDVVADALSDAFNAQRVKKEQIATDRMVKDCIVSAKGRTAIIKSTAGNQITEQQK